MGRPTVIGCGVFGGRSPRTGRAVGERHRWGGGAWGVGRCEFCGKYLEDVLEKREVRIGLEEAIARGEVEAGDGRWEIAFWDGSMGIEKGWYGKRKAAGGATEWLRNNEGELLRWRSREEADQAMSARA